MMRQQVRVLVLSVCVFILAAFLACATTSTPHTEMEIGAEYSAKPPPGIESPEAAIKDLAVLLKNRKRPVCIEFGKRYHAQQGPKGLIWQDEWKELSRGIGNDLVELFFYDLPSRSLKACVLRNLPVLKDGFLIYPSISIPYAGFYDSPLSVKASGDTDYPYAVEVRDWISFKFPRRDLADAQRFADDLFFMQQWERKAQEQKLSLFEAHAAEYRALTIKPLISEEQRKIIVQANALNQQREYAGAIELYLKAVEIDPVAYPGAYFNLALLSARQHRFNSAITYMKHYLLLVPNAKDVRSAQDKIYEWEIMMEKKK